ncbi:response regulator [[Clostridium] sordellii ATCC 9714]|nr:response regulator [[Clostridium] sordellii ATCC 9714] [Paeniclostridium sordellii ATCC 9714]
MKNKNILVIEDDSNIQELIVEFLSAEGYNVKSANDGIEGIQTFKKEEFDLVILDVMMPNLDGYGVCKMIRQSSNIPIIFLTALDQESDQIKGFDLMCDDYITKPFSFTLLMKRVEAVLRRTCNDSESNILTFEKLTLDLDTYQAYLDGNTIELTLKEFNILKTLIKIILKS